MGIPFEFPFVNAGYQFVRSCACDNIQCDLESGPLKFSCIDVKASHDLLNNNSAPYSTRLVSVLQSYKKKFSSHFGVQEKHVLLFHHDGD